MPRCFVVPFVLVSAAVQPQRLAHAEHVNGLPAVHSRSGQQGNHCTPSVPQQPKWSMLQQPAPPRTQRRHARTSSPGVVQSPSTDTGHAVPTPDRAGLRAQLLDEDRPSVRAGDGVQRVKDHAEVRPRYEVAQHGEVEHFLQRRHVVSHAVDHLDLKEHRGVDRTGVSNGALQIANIKRRCELYICPSCILLLINP